MFKTANVLIIEDDQLLNDQVSEILINNNFLVEQCFDGEAGLEKAINNKYDLILLDVLLPKLDGFSVLKRLRSCRDTPVIMITACGAEEERIKGFSRGADDYLPKPFNIEELMLRINALLRRTMNNKKNSINRAELNIGLFSLNKHLLQASYNKKPLTLTNIEFNLLWVLLENKNEILSKPYLYQIVLEREFSAYDRSLDMHISRIRRKLIGTGMFSDGLKTVHGKGYRLS
ncbi:DNA-binding response regulator [Psychromonas sp. B3M02]|uniref:response regulator transcription factor n=1 Tax=unclassified Psychromonas TaxID=2614957 RepID=UPI000DE8424B|nr:response regulator transcription factor [Psychromonas sp. B3M02]RBW43591.1 DNA-binding response regulator [Psychromonas sp. B3M02]